MFLQVKDKQPVLKVTGLQVKRSGFETGQSVVFLEKTLYSNGASLPRTVNEYGEIVREA